MAVSTHACAADNWLKLTYLKTWSIAKISQHKKSGKKNLNPASNFNPK